MSLDDLFGLFILFAFVVLPLLGRVLRGRTNQPGRPSANPPRPSAQAPPPRPVVAPLPEDERQKSAFEQRLEEARKRVLEAQGQSGSQPTRQTPRRGAAQATAQPSRQAPPPATVFTPGPTQTSVLTPAADAPLLAPPRPQPPTRSAAFLPRESETAIATISKPLEVIRKRRPRRAKLQAALLSFEEQDFLRGVIWQQILNEPRAKRPYGRELSRRP